MLKIFLFFWWTFFLSDFFCFRELLWFNVFFLKCLSTKVVMIATSSCIKSTNVFIKSLLFISIKFGKHFHLLLKMHSTSVFSFHAILTFSTWYFWNFSWHRFYITPHLNEFSTYIDLKLFSTTEFSYLFIFGLHNFIYINFVCES